MGKWLAANRVTVNHSNSHLPAYSLLSPGTAVFPLVWRNVQADQQVYNTAGWFSTSSLTAVNQSATIPIHFSTFIFRTHVARGGVQHSAGTCHHAERVNYTTLRVRIHCRHLRVPRPQDRDSRFERSTGKSLIIIIIIIIWHYNPLWVFAFSAKSLQVLLSLALSFQFFILSFFRPSMTSSCHRCLGLPTGPIPIGFQSNSFLVGLAWSIRWICPSYLTICALMNLNISAPSVNLSVSMFQFQ